MEYLRALMDGEASDGAMRFVASTDAVGRDGIVVDQSGWELDNYRANPVFLWNHGRGVHDLPIGRTSVELDGGKLITHVGFDPDDPFAQEVRGKYERGFLNAVSVRWLPLKIVPGRPPRVTRSELIEISGVPVGGDAQAVRARDFDPDTLRQMVQALLAEEVAAYQPSVLQQLHAALTRGD